MALSDLKPFQVWIRSPSMHGSTFSSLSAVRKKQVLQMCPFRAGDCGSPADQRPTWDVPPEIPFCFFLRYHGAPIMKGSKARDSKSV